MIFGKIDNGYFEYVEKFFSEPRLMGGCIWEWADHAVLVDGVQKYGGDFNEAVHDDNCCCDGMVFSDEPGVYKAGEYGIRIEDTITLKDGKVQSFMFKTDRNLIIL